MESMLSCLTLSFGYVLAAYGAWDTIVRHLAVHTHCRKLKYISMPPSRISLWEPDAKEVSYFGTRPVAISISAGSNPKFSDAVKELRTRRVKLINTGYRNGPNSTIYHLKLLDVKWSLSIEFNRPWIANSVKKNIASCIYSKTFPLYYLTPSLKSEQWLCFYQFYAVKSRVCTCQINSGFSVTSLESWLAQGLN